jgi:hypothetical protein
VLFTVVLTGPSAPALAADTACPIVETAAVAQAVGASVTGGVELDPISNAPLDTGPDLTVCLFDSAADSTVTVTRQRNAFGPGGVAGPAALALSRTRLPDEARAEVEALNQSGVSDIHLPTYQMTSASGLGDAAVWVFQNDPALNFTSGGFFIQRGVDAYVLGVAGPDEATAKTQATALAQAVLASVP